MVYTVEKNRSGNPKMGFYERREKIKEILRRKGRVQCTELAEEFMVSKNTILKDINAITPTFPIATTYGRNGGYQFTGDGTVWLNERQTQYVYAYMCKHGGDPGDETFREIIEILEHAKPTNP